MKSQVRGGTRWKRFAVVMVPGVAATAAVGIGLAQGALAASFSVSGQQFKVTAGHLPGQGFAQYGGVDSVYTSTEGKARAGPGRHLVVRRRDDHQDVSVGQDGRPLRGETVYLRLEAGNNAKKPVEAENLYIDVAQSDADAEFKNIDIGVAVKDKTRGPANKDEKTTLPGGFAQQAETADLYDVKQTAWATTAWMFKLSGLSMRLGTDSKMECY
ncbi:Cholesterol esterase OS=Streptomyces griseomycini OX=66895 GN=FHS37_000922 PE=4 SV=1 [Streptomyces griseomycini]